MPPPKKTVCCLFVLICMTEWTVIPCIWMGKTEGRVGELWVLF